MRVQRPILYLLGAVLIALAFVLSYWIGVFSMPAITTASDTTATAISKTTAVSQSTATCLSQPTTTSSVGNALANSTLPLQLGNPVLVHVYLNGSIILGTMSFNVKPGSQSIINIKTTYPWASYPEIPKQTCIPISFEIYPFPAFRNTSSIPDYLHVSFAPQSSLIMAYGQNASADMVITADTSKMTPAQLAGEEVAGAVFELGIHYIDPASGSQVTEMAVVNIAA